MHIHLFTSIAAMNVPLISHGLLVLSNPLLIWCATVRLGQAEDGLVQELSFQSWDYRNVLHWTVQPAAPDATLYDVQYKIYGDKKWTVVKHCQAISALQCDVSKEMANPKEWYYARVQATANGVQSQWVESPRFYPLWESSFSPPQMKLNVTHQSIVVRLRPPRTPLRRASGRPIPVTKYHPLHFRIHLTQGDMEEEIHEIEGCATELLLPNLLPRITYCLQAETVVPRRGYVSPKGTKTCVTTK